MRMLCTANNGAGEYVDNRVVAIWCVWTEDCVDEIMMVLNWPFSAILQTCPKSVICWDVHKVVWMRMAWVNCCNSNLSLCLALHVSFLQTKYKMHCQPMQHFVTQTFNRCSSCVPISSDGGFHLCTLSVGVPFRGDHIGLRRNPLWKEVLAKNSLQRMDRFVVFADIVNKINRSNGKARGFCVSDNFECRLTTNQCLTSKYWKSWIEPKERCLTWLHIIPALPFSCFDWHRTSFSVDNY